MRILTFTSLYPSAANPQHGIFVETRLRELLARHDCTAEVLAPVPWFPFTGRVFGRYAEFASAPIEEMRHGVRVFHPRHLVVPKIGMRLAPYLLYWRSLACAKRIISGGYDFDLIDAHYFYPDGVAAAWLGRALGKPVAITARGSDVNVILDDPFALRLIREAAASASALIAVSNSLKARMVERGLPGEKISVLRNGVDLEKFTPAPDARHTLVPGWSGPILASVGNLVPVKDHALAFQALAALPDCFLLVAGDGPLRGALAELARSMGIAGRVRFLGRVPQQDLKQVYSAADLLLLTSRSEGWPNVLLESMACGRPVASVPLPGVEDIIGAREAGLIAPDRDPRSLAQAASKLLAERAPPESVRAYAASFDWRETADGIYNLFTRILNSHGRSSGPARG